MDKGGRRPLGDIFYDASHRETTDTVVDRGFFFDDNDSTPHLHVSSTRLKKKFLKPKGLDDPLATWVPFQHYRGDLEDDTSTPPSNDTSWDSLMPVDDDDVEEGKPTGTKRKRYASSDEPNLVWRPEAITLLRELHRYDGLGDFLEVPSCGSCGVVYGQQDNNSSVRIFRCKDCDVILRCLHCCLDRHETNPLHHIAEWNGDFFDSTTLSALGLVYQLGHGGLPCFSPESNVRKMVVMESNGIHQVSYRYCACSTTFPPTNIQQLMRAGWYPATPTDPRSCATFRCLDTFRLLNVGANVNARDYVSSLEKQTNALEPKALPDRYVTFARMGRQWAFLFRCKRSGKVVDLTSVDDIEEGSLAELCWACPHPAINLPPGWERVDRKYSYLYMPVMAFDANFRLKSRLRPNERVDHSLAPGSSYFVAYGPYKEHLKNYVSEEDVSTCIAFAALLEKDTKLSTGLRNSGVGACACARHEIIRPLGIGDLQKGERYSNMDYIFFSAIRNMGVRDIAVSYDISCQWKQNLNQRRLLLPQDLQDGSEGVAFTFGLPTWHAVVHELSCKSANSLTYQDGVGRTDGEGIERIWSILNPAGFATKEMGEGTRHDHLDDRIDHLNFQKNLSLGVTLARRLKAAIVERNKQVEGFRAVDEPLYESVRKAWHLQVDTWKLDHSKPNPYLLPDIASDVTEARVRANLKAQEEKEKEARSAPVSGTSETAFITAGLELEDIQLRLLRDVKATSQSEAHKASIYLRRAEFEEKLEGFRSLQRIYMPTVVRLLDAEDKQRGDSRPPMPEHVKLWFPSNLSSQERLSGCGAGLPYIEAELRDARCSDALNSLRHNLHAKQYLIAFRNANVTGQRDSGKARGLIDNVGERVNADADKYRRSRQALLQLITPLDHFPPLLEDDVALDQVTDPDLLAIAKLGGNGRGGHRLPHVSTGKKTMSWIWTANGGPTTVAPAVNAHQSPVTANATPGDKSTVSETVRVEWSKALARKDRWTEEVERLRQEMKCVLRFLEFKAAWWINRAPTIDPTKLHLPTTAYQSGIRAYAFRRAAQLRRISDSFQALWSAKKSPAIKTMSNPPATPAL